MPTIITHAIVPLAVAGVVGPSRISPRLALAGAVLAMLPDADVIGFKFGIEYADEAFSRIARSVSSHPARRRLLRIEAFCTAEAVT